MKKEDLKTGMRVTLRSGKTGIVYRGCSHSDYILYSDEHGNGFDGLPSWDENLIDIGICSGEHDIIKIEDLSSLNLKDYKTIWERSEVKEYTMEEAIKAMGHEFKIKK